MTQPNIRQKLLASPTPLEQIKAMCQRAEVDSLDAWGRAEDGDAKIYHYGEAAAYRGVLTLIKALEEENRVDGVLRALEADRKEGK